MLRILLVADKIDAFEELAQALNNEGQTEILWAHDSQTALDKATVDAPGLAIVDEYIGEVEGLDWIQHLISVNAFIQTAVVSRLPHEVFHDISEGLGIMAQLPPRPGESDARRVLEVMGKMPGFE